MKKIIIHSDYAPKAVGPYSQAIRIGDFLYSSGQVPINPKSSKIEVEGIKEQTRQVMENLKAVLTEAGLDFENVVKTTCFLSDMKNYADFNSVYSEYFVSNPPARSCVQVAKLPLESLVEVEIVACY